MAKTKIEAKKEADAKIIRFTSENKGLFVGELNIDFIDGKYETVDLKVAEYLDYVYGVKRVGE